MNRTAIASAFAVVAVAMVAASPAIAAPSRQALSEAKRRFERGNELYVQGSYAEALQLYQAAYALVPSLDISFNIGLAQEKVLEHERCVATFRDYLERAPDADPARPRAAEALARCRTKARVEVRVSSIPPGAAIRLGGADAEAASFRGRTPAELRLAPGRYAITLELPGHVTATRNLDVEVGRGADVGAGIDVDFPLEKLSVLAIEAEVSGAMVQVGDDPPEPAPLRRELRAGTYRVRVFHDGYREVVRDVRVQPGETSTLMVALPRLAVVGQLSFEAPPGARVWMNDEELGPTPASAVAPGGEHRIRIAAPGRVPFATVVAIRDDRDHVLTVDLPALRTRRERIAMWSLAGLTGGLAAGALTYGALALRDERDYSERPTIELGMRGDDRARTADFLWSAAAVAATAALVTWWLTEPEPARGALR